MKNFFKKVVLMFSVITLLVSNNIYAEEVPEVITLDPVAIHLEITTEESSLYDNDLSVSACDSDNNPDTADTITAYCAILQSGLSNDWTWYDFGALLNSIGDVAGYISQDQDGNDVYHYWSWSLNGNLGEVGLNQYELQSGDTISLTFIDPVVEIIVEEEVVPSPSHHHSGGSSTKKKKGFSLEKVSLFLSENQKQDGSFGELLYSDWVAVGVAESGKEFDLIKNKLFDNTKNNNFESSIITDNERHIMALMALGINPYNGTQINYINKITSSFDGNQIGDASLYNDDIFGLIVLYKAGYKEDDEIIKKVLSFVISKQSSDGSWENVDLTSASIQALSNFESVSGVEESILKAESYLKEKQKENGSFEDNVFSTSWAIQALSQNESFDSEINKAIEYIKNTQQDDGGIIENSNIENKIWATAYVIPAILKLSWNDILKSFPKEEIKLDILKNENKVEIKTEIQNKKEIIKKDDPLNNKTQINNNSLSATVINYNQENTKNNLSLFNKTLKKLVSPFVWIYSLF